MWLTVEREAQPRRLSWRTGLDCVGASLSLSLSLCLAGNIEAATRRTNDGRTTRHDNNTLYSTRRHFRALPSPCCDGRIVDGWLCLRPTPSPSPAPPLRFDGAPADPQSTRPPATGCSCCCPRPAWLPVCLPACLPACPSSAARRPPPAAAVLEFLMKLGVRARARLVGRGPRCRSRSIHAP